MQEQKMKKLYILCGLANDAGDEIKTALAEAAKEQGYEAVCVSRYRKEGIRQYVAEHREFRILVLQEAMQTNYPYTAEELAELMDDYHLNIVISIKKSHRADKFMKVLYTAGILNALYEDDATAKNIMARILYPRTRRECRRYYQITTAADAMKTLEIVDEERMKGYLSYIDEATENSEIKRRCSYILQSLQPVEKLYFIQRLSQSVQTIIQDDVEYQSILKQQQKRKRHLFGRRKEKKEQEISEKMPSVQEPVQVEIKKQAEPQIEELLDEDISDLLGFGNDDKGFLKNTIDLLPTTVEEFPPEEKENELPEKTEGEFNGKETSKEKKNEIFLKIFAVTAGAFFIAMVILFGFFLYAESKTKESSTPEIYQQGSVHNNQQMGDYDEPIDIEKESSKELADADLKAEAGENQEQKEKTPKIGEGEEDNIPPKENSTEKKTSEIPKVQEIPVRENVAENMSVPSSQSQSETSKPNVDIITSSPPQPDNVEQNEAVINYNGSIVTGSEVIRIAAEKETEGRQIYLITRDHGEGSFHASEVEGLVDRNCSYLIQDTGNGQIRFIQQ